MILKAVFFGASVTAQEKSHSSGEVTGFYPHIVEYFKSKPSTWDITRISAGSSHFDTAGYCLLDKVIQLKPDVVFVDWHTTSLEIFNPNLFKSFLNKLAQSNIYTIFMLLPRKSILRDYLLRPNIKQTISVKSDMVDVMDFYKLIPAKGINIYDILRDECHTNSLGARIYADIILEKLNSIPRRNRVQSKKRMDTINVSEFKISDEYIKIKEITMTIKRCTDLMGIHIVLDNKIGPFSPIISLKNEDYEIDYSLWDTYCHYTRNNFSGLPANSSRHK